MLFSFNSMELTWLHGISKLSVCLLNQIITLNVSYQNIMKFAYLLESSTVVPVENIFHGFSSVASNSMKIDLLKHLLYNLPIYHFSLPSKEYIANYHETICSEVINKILSVRGHDKEIREDDDFHDGSKKNIGTNETQKIGPKKKLGQPSIISKFPVIRGVITDFLKTNGYKLQL